MLLVTLLAFLPVLLVSPTKKFFRLGDLAGDFPNELPSSLEGLLDRFKLRQWIALCSRCRLGRS
jgi:hypothetical protein